MFSPRHRILSPVLLLLCCSACGDAFVDSSYRGSPLFGFRGQIATVEGQGFDTEHPYNVRLSVFWSPDWSPEQPATLKEQASASVSISFPSTFDVELFQPPSNTYFSANDRYAIGRLLLYDDVDNDKRYTAGVDKWVGGAPNKGILYGVDGHISTAMATPDNPSRFHLINLPIFCGENTPTDDGRPEARQCRYLDKYLGAPCQRSEDCCDTENTCGSMTCIKEGTPPWKLPGGYCAVADVPASQRDDCAYRGGVWQEWFTGRNAEQPFEFMYFKECNDADGCDRPGYTCTVVQRSTDVKQACMPDPVVYLEVEPNYAPRRSFCGRPRQTSD